MKIYLRITAKDLKKYPYLKRILKRKEIENIKNKRG